MEMQEVLECSTDMDGSVSNCNGGIEKHNGNIEEMETLGEDILHDWDSYWDDIGDRLTVSRMVSDSVIKGMICAVEEEAAEKIAQKELELARLKETLRVYRVGAYGDELMGCSSLCKEPKLRGKWRAAEEQFKSLKKEINKIKGSEIDKMKCSEINKFKSPSSIRRIGSGSQLYGLSGILQENMPGKWMDVERTLDGLRTAMQCIYDQTEEMVCLSKSSLSDWLQERDFEAEIQRMVLKSSIHSLQEEFEQRFWGQNAQTYGEENANWLEKMKEVSSLRQELVSVSNFLSVPESGQLISHGSLEHRKASSNHVSSTSLWEGNGKHDESLVVPENLDHAQLNHFTVDELFNHLKAEMTKMKRHYESKEHEMIEEYFSLKREYLNLKERGSSLPARKEKELDNLRKKIPEVILKLDSILTENEKRPSFSYNGDCFDNLKNRLESTRLENSQLRDLLTDKEKEIKSLSWQVSDAGAKVLEHSVAEENLSKMLENLKGRMDDAQLESSFSDDLYKFLLKEVVGQVKGFSEELEIEYDIMQGFYEIMLKEAAENAEPHSEMKFDDSVLESIIMREICEVVFREALKEAEEKVVTWNLKYMSEKGTRESLEFAILENEQSLRLCASEKEKLEQEMLLLRAMIDDKNNMVLEATMALTEEREKYESTSQELENLRVQTIHQDKLISNYDGKLQIVRGDLDKAMEKIKMHKEETSKLREQLEIELQKLREVVEEKNALTREHQNTLQLVEAREREHRKQTNSTFILVQGLSKALSDFEYRANEDMEINSLRLKKVSSQLWSLIRKANNLRRTGLLYKEKLERKSSDLQKAEAEVDLLGNEVDTLLSLLEKIYIALDHYSPILQHYPGIMEILKLVRRELSGESVKPV
ncbi:WPP domain-associated protein [Mercurialis annua]|uniref:WPP domain-associated protein n=1 Tax=Mercurialis annua TaxID=3986 RepID=UPI00215ECE53|nr:WPP domain-associated protein [Mercurialis annua]